jgi:HEPN domain-containing protein
MLFKNSLELKIAVILKSKPIIMKKNKLQDALPELYRFLTGFAGAQKIFSLAQHSGTPSYVDLMIVMPEMPLSPPMQLIMAMELGGIDSHHVAGTICQSDYLDKMLAEGQIYYTLACTDETLVYSSTEWKKPAIDSQLRNEMIEKARRIFYNGFAKAQSFLFMAQVQQKLPAISMFMLHQAIEIALYTLMKALTGRGKPSHQLEELFLYSFRYNDKLPLLFMDGDEENQRLLDLLNQAYRESRYKDQFQVEAQEVTVCLDKVKKLHEITEQVFLDLVKRYEMIA